MPIKTDVSPGASQIAQEVGIWPKPVIAVIFCSLLYTCGLIYYASVRPLDGDEGFYTSAARLVWEGKTPYRDFFFQQAPLLPYLYSWIWAIHPRSVVAMRMLSAACGGLEVLLLGLGLVSTGRWPAKVGLAAFGALLLNPYSVSWNVVVKTFAAANLLMTVALIFLYLALRSKRWAWFFGTGLALGLCVAVRSLYGLIIPALGLAMLHHELRKSYRSYANCLSFLLGSLIGGLPMIVSFLRYPRAFIFNNITYHHFDVGYMISGNGIITEGYQSIGHVAFVYFAMICIRLLLFHPYFTGQFILAIVGILSLKTLRQEASNGSCYDESDFLYFQFVLLILTVYLATVLLPFPPYDQHFVSPLAPLLIPFVGEGLRVTQRARRRRVIALALVAPLLFAIEVGRETARNSWHSVWQLSTYHAITKVVEVNSSRDDIVLSFWPGFVFESGRRYFPGLENHFVFRIINKTSQEEKARYHVPSKEEILHAIKERKATIVIIHPWILEYYHDLSPSELEEFKEAISANYLLVSSVQEVEVYKRMSTEAR